MASKNHALARKLVQDALDRFTAPERIEHEGDAQLIVLGAILEEVGNGHSGWGDKAKAAAMQTVPPFAGMGGLLFLLSVLGVI